MGLRDVQEIVEACEGLPDDATLETFARHLTVGDLRLLLYCAESMLGVEEAARRMPALASALEWFGRAD